MKIPPVKFLKFWFPVIAYSVIIFYVSGIPRLVVRVPIPFFDKLLHAGEYAVLGFLCARAVFGTARQHHRQHIVLLVALFCFLYGCTDEYHQLFVAGRAASLADALADGIGGTLGALLYRS